MIINPTTNFKGEINLLGAILSIASCIIILLISEFIKRKRSKNK